MEITVANESNNYGGEARWLLAAAADDGLGFRFLRSVYSDDKPVHVARHRHPFAQVRWAEKGPRCIGLDQFIPEGDIAYFPHGAYYGPEVLGDIPGGVACTTLQFGFNSEYQPMRGEIEWRLLRDGIDPEEIAKRLPKVEVHATSESDPDWKAEDTKMDDWRVTARPVAGGADAPTIAPANFESVILIHPTTFQYVEEAPGVEIRRLGRFFDHPGPNGDTRLTMVRLSKGGVYRLGADRAQVVWSVSPGMQINGRTFPAVTSLYSPRDEEVEITTDDTVEIHVVDLPRLD